MDKLSAVSELLLPESELELSGINKKHGFMIDYPL